MMNEASALKLRQLGIKPDGIKYADITQGSKGRLVVHLEYYDNRVRYWYFKGVPSELAGPDPNTSFLRWVPTTREEFYAMGPI